jgi:hypothetical protein
MKHGILAVVIVSVSLTFLSPNNATASPMYGYSFGVSLQNTVVPGSVVSISAGLKNTGDTSIVFPPSFPGGMPSVQGGSTPFAGTNSSGDWSILSNGFTFGPSFGIQDFFVQFENIIINPGDVFSFVFGTFIAPTDQPLGSSADPGLNFGISFTDTIIGNLLGISNHYSFNNSPRPFFTLGNQGFTSDLTFFQGLVVDTTTGQIISGPAPIPEPTASLLFGLGAIVFAGALRRKKKQIFFGK